MLVEPNAGTTTMIRARERPLGTQIPGMETIQYLQASDMVYV